MCANARKKGQDTISLVCDFIIVFRFIISQKGPKKSTDSKGDVFFLEKKGTGHVAVAMRSEIKNFCWCICPILCPMPRYIHICMLFFLISFILCFSYRWKIEYKKKRNVKFWNIVSISPCSQPPKKKVDEKPKRIYVCISKR